MNFRAIMPWIIIGIGCAGLSAILLFSYGHLLDGDASAFLVVGRGMLSGSPAYIGLWDHKPPGIYEIAALANWLSPSNPNAGMQWLSALSIGASAAMVGGLIAHVTRRSLAGTLSALFVALALSDSNLVTGGGMSELFSVLGMSLAFIALAVDQHLTESRFQPLSLLAGFGLGFAINVSLLSIAVIPALAWLWLRRPAQGQSGRVCLDLVGLVYFGLGGLIATGLAWVPVVVSGALPVALDAVFGYSSLYRSLSIWNLNIWIITLLALRWLILPLLVILSGPVRRSRLFVPCLLWLAGVAGILLFGIRLYPHYLLLAVPVMGLLLGMAIMAIPSLRTEPKWQTLWPAVLVIVVGLTFFGDLYTPRNSGGDVAANQAIVTFIKTLPDQNGPIYAWGNNSDIYIRSDRLVAGRYFYLLPLMTPVYGPPAAAELLADWQAQAPVVIVDSSAPARGRGVMSPLLVDHQGNTEDGRTLSSDLDGLRAFVRAHYHLATTIAGQPIYVLNQP